MNKVDTMCPCPFCGSYKLEWVFREWNTWNVSCFECGCLGPESQNIDESEAKQCSRDKWELRNKT